MSLGRRAAAAAAAAAAAVLGASFGVPHPADAALDPVQNLTRRGMAKFVQNDVEGSIADFDLIIDADPNRAPYLWQRGLSLYYADRFTDGAAQFRTDVAVNPNDTEEAIWAFLCEARTLGFERARERLLKVGPDPRAYMREAYALFSGEGSEAALRAVGERGPAEEFYSLLYVGLWREARGEAEPAREAMVGAVKSLYGQRSGDYMAGLAAVHCKRRGWEVA